MRYFIPIFIIVVGVILSILGPRGKLSKNTPIEVFPDMDRQAKYKSQTTNEFFGDKRADRLPVEGTVLRGNGLDLKNVFNAEPDFGTIGFRTGKDDKGAWMQKIPTEVGIDMSLMRMGKERYDIHCSACHGKYGNGRGVTSQFGLNPKNLSDLSKPYLEQGDAWADGRLFNAISMGSGVSPQKPFLEDDPKLQKALASQIMLGLKDKLSPKERWAIVFYLRALQKYVGEATLQEKEGKDS
jgi:hypothetical protein